MGGLKAAPGEATLHPLCFRTCHDNPNKQFLVEICTMAHCKIKETNNYAIHNQGNWLSFFFFYFKKIAYPFL